MKWPSFRRKTSKLGSDRELQSASEGESKSEVATKMPRTASNLSKSNISQISGSTTSGSEFSTSSSSLWDHQSKASEGAVDPRLRPSTLALAEKRLAKLDENYELQPEPSSTGMGAHSWHGSSSSLVSDYEHTSGQARPLSEDDVIAVVECHGCIWKGNCVNELQESKLAQFWAGKFFPACA